MKMFDCHGILASGRIVSFFAARIITDRRFWDKQYASKLEESRRREESVWLHRTEIIFKYYLSII